MKKMSQDLKDATESSAVTMFSREFQVLRTVQLKALPCPKKVVLWNGMDSNGTTVEEC